MRAGPQLPGALVKVKLGQLQVAGLRNLQINLRTVHHGYGISGALDNEASSVPTKPSAVASAKARWSSPVAEALGGLRQHDVFARNGGGDESAVGGSLHLLDGVDGGHADDGCAELSDGVDGAVDGGRVDERAHSVVDQNDVVWLGGQGGEGVGDRLLAVVAALDDQRTRRQVKPYSAIWA